MSFEAPRKEERIAAHRATPRTKLMLNSLYGQWGSARMIVSMLWRFNRRLLAAVILGWLGMVFALTAIILLVLGLLTGCGPSKGPARSAAYAGDGVTQFGSPPEATGKLKWGVTYSAHYVDTTDRQNCRWSLYTINKQGDHEVQILKRGNYFNAKVNVGQQFTKDVFLKSLECGLWKP